MKTAKEVARSILEGALLDKQNARQDFLHHRAEKMKERKSKKIPLHDPHSDAMSDAKYDYIEARKRIANGED